MKFAIKLLRKKFILIEVVECSRNIVTSRYLKIWLVYTLNPLGTSEKPKYFVLK
ncbi:MAG: hypothetical protein AAB953_03905 [Patescibacteria group bacterium]